VLVATNEQIILPPPHKMQYLLHIVPTDSGLAASSESIQNKPPVNCNYWNNVEAAMNVKKTRLKHQTYLVKQKKLDTHQYTSKLKV